MALNFGGNFARAAELVSDTSLSELAVDGSSVPQDFDFKPLAGQAWQMHRLRFAISDSSMRFDRFGGLSALTNGIELGRVNAAGVFTSFIEGNLPIKTNVDLAAYCSDFQIIDWSGTTDTLLVDWDFQTLLGGRIPLDEEESLRIRINDDLTNLNTFQMICFYTKLITRVGATP